MAKTKIDRFKSKLLSNDKIALDSMIFIYQFSDHLAFAPLTNIVFELLEDKKIQAITSTITITEVFVQPEREKNQINILEYEKVFQQLPNLEIIPIDWQLARVASKLRALYNGIKTPDALQISTALLKGYSTFLTNDEKLKQVDLLEVITLKDYL